MKRPTSAPITRSSGRLSGCCYIYEDSAGAQRCRNFPAGTPRVVFLLTEMCYKFLHCDSCYAADPRSTRFRRSTRWVLSAAFPSVPITLFGGARHPAWSRASGKTQQVLAGSQDERRENKTNRWIGESEVPTNTEKATLISERGLYLCRQPGSPASLVLARWGGSDLLSHALSRAVVCPYLAR